MAATGVLTNAVDAGRGMRTLTYHAEDVHDFAWMADPYMDVISGQARLADGGTVEVRVYHRPEQRGFAQRHLEAGIGAIEKFSAMFVPYPWPIMTIIDPPPEAADGAGGMEYPTLVTTGRRLGVRAPRDAAARVRHRARGRPQLVPGHARVQRGRGGLARRGRQRVGGRPRDGRDLRAARLAARLDGLAGRDLGGDARDRRRAGCRSRRRSRPRPTRSSTAARTATRATR